MVRQESATADRRSHPAQPPGFAAVRQTIERPVGGGVQPFRGTWHTPDRVCFDRPEGHARRSRSGGYLRPSTSEKYDDLQGLARSRPGRSHEEGPGLDPFRQKEQCRRAWEQARKSHEEWCSCPRHFDRASRRIRPPGHQTKRRGRPQPCHTPPADHEPPTSARRVARTSMADSENAPYPSCTQIDANDFGVCSDILRVAMTNHSADIQCGDSVTDPKDKIRVMLDEQDANSCLTDCPNDVA